jgi:hypothetical protein
VQIGLEIEPQAGALKTEGITFIPHGGEELSEALKSPPRCSCGWGTQLSRCRPASEGNAGQKFGRRTRRHPRGSLARPSPDPGQHKLCACETCRQRPQRSRDSRLGLDQLRRRSGRSPGQPTTHIPADQDRNRKGASSLPRSNGQAFDELATRSPWRGAAVGRQAGSAHVGTRHTHAVPP